MKEKNKGNSLKKVLIFLAIVLVSVISFAGIYVKDGNQMKNIMPEYLIGSDLEGYRAVKIKVSDATKDIIKDTEGNIIESATDEEIEEKGYTKTTEPVNKEEDKNRDNFLEARRIIANRLETLNVSDYKVRQDLDNGSIILEIKEDARTDDIISSLLTKGKFEIQNNETKEVLLTDEDIKGSQVLYRTTATGTTIYLNIEFNKEAAKKLEEMSKEFVKTTDSEGKTTEKLVNLLLDDESMTTISFPSVITNGKLQLSVGSQSAEKVETKDSSTLNKNVVQAQNMATILSNGEMPLTYASDSNRYVQTFINKTTIRIVLIVAVAVLGVMMLALIVKFKCRGLLAVISHIGFNAILLLLVRVWNVEIGLAGIMALGLSQIINYILLVMMLNNEPKKAIVKFALRIIPASIISIVFVFMGALSVFSFGMVLVWAIATAVIYNALVTRFLIER